MDRWTAADEHAKAVALKGAVDVLSGLAGAPPPLTVEGQIVVDGRARFSTLSVTTPADWRPLPSTVPSLVAPRLTGALTLWTDSTVSISASSERAQAVTLVPNVATLLEAQVGMSIDRYWPDAGGSKTIKVNMSGVISVSSGVGALNMTMAGTLGVEAETAR